MCLADSATDHGECWPSIDYIAARCEASRSFIRMQIGHLEKRGWLTRTVRHGTATIYHLSLDRSRCVELPAPNLQTQGPYPHSYEGLYPHKI